MRASFGLVPVGGWAVSLGVLGSPGFVVGLAHDMLLPPPLGRLEAWTMSRVRLLLFLSVMAVLVVGAVAASEASAAAPNWVINGTAFTGSETVLGLLSNGNASLESTIFTVPMDILCTAADATGTILGGNKDAFPNGITFTGCSISTPSGCTPTNPIALEPVTSTLLSNETVGLDTWTPTSGTEFTRFTLSGSACSIEGVYKVTGQLQCEGTLNTEAETFACLFNKNSGNGQLKFGSNTADFLAHFLFLLKGANDGKSWGASTKI
jgi:hypothetical protein